VAGDHRLTHRNEMTANRRSHPMEALIALIAVVATLAILDVAALLFGADSRDGFADDCLTTTLS